MGEESHAIRIAVNLPILQRKIGGRYSQCHNHQIYVRDPESVHRCSVTFRILFMYSHNHQIYIRDPESDNQNSTIHENYQFSDQIAPS